MTSVTKSVPLGSVARFVNGAAFKPTDWDEDGARIIRIQNLNDPEKPYNCTHREVGPDLQVHPGDLLVSWSASLGVFVWGGPDVALLNQHIFRVFPDEKLVDKDYLRYALQVAIEKMKGQVHGATMQHINRGEFLATEIPLPPIDEQRRIAAILDKADEVRAKRRATQATSGTLGHAVFVEMFGSPLANPYSFEVLSLGEIASQVTDGEHATPERTIEGVKLLSARNVRDGYLDLTDVDHVSAEVHSKLKARCNPVAGDILISCSGTIGRVSQVPGTEPFSLVRSVAMVRPIPEKVRSTYLEFYLRNREVREWMVRRAHSSAQANLFQNHIRAIPVVTPPLELQSAFEERVRQLTSIELSVASAVTSAEELFGSLRQRAFQGAL